MRKEPKHVEVTYQCVDRTLDPNPTNRYLDPAGFLQMLRQCYGIKRYKLVRDTVGDWRTANGKLILKRQPPKPSVTG